MLFGAYLLSNSEEEAPGVVNAPGVTSARSIADLLPRSEREAQRLRVIEVRGLVKEERLGAAQARARDYFERWPDGPDTAALEALTGVHAPRSP